MPIAIITGSDSGIGKATAVQLAQDGFDIGITWHADEEGAGKTADEVRQAGGRAEVRQLDPAKGYCFRLVAVMPRASGTTTAFADASVRGCIAASPGTSPPT